jgi:hypothetical protein
MYPVTKVTDADVAFPARVEHLMPEYNELVDKRKDPEHQRLEKIAQLLFFKGGKTDHWVAKEGIDKHDAVRQIFCVLGSFQPKHEHKIAAVAFLLGEWFIGIEDL